MRSDMPDKLGGCIETLACEYRRCVRIETDDGVFIMQQPANSLARCAFDRARRDPRLWQSLACP